MENITLQREQEILDYTSTPEFVNYCDSIYMFFFKSYKKQWRDKTNIPSETNSDFWTELLDDAAARAWFPNSSDIQFENDEEQRFFGSLVDRYYKSDNFKLKIKKLKNEWKKQIISRDFR